MRKSRIKRNSKKVYPHLCQIVFLTHQNGEDRKAKRDIGTSADDSALPFAVARFSFHKCEFFFGSLFRALCLYFKCAYFGFQYTIGILFTNWQHVRVLFFCFSIFFCDAVSRPIYKFSCVRGHVYVYVCMCICISVCLCFPRVF